MNKLICLSPYFLIVLFFCGCSESQPISKYPNIIYILADDMGYGDVSAFNENGKIITKNIDQLAAEGMMFTDAHTTSSVCTPTRYSILTGRYNWRTRLKSRVLTGKSKALIANDRTTVASMLRDHGYYTAFIGKWHLGWDWALKNNDDFGGDGWQPDHFENLDFSKPVTNTPNDLGFDYAYGHSGSLDMAPYVYVENGNITAIPDRITVDTAKFTWWREGPTGSDFAHEDVTPNFFRRSISLIEERAKEENPFFLYLALPSPHTPILPTADWKGKSGLNVYADFVLMIDDYIGKVLDAVNSSGIEENTLVIFHTDNGCSPQADFDQLEALGHDPSYVFRGHKADIFEGGHRVPYIAKWPGKIAKGSKSDRTICAVDFIATCADIIDYSLSDNEGEDSYSLLPLFEQKAQTAYTREATVHHSINGSFAIRKGEWKLIMCPGSGGWSFPKPDDAAIETLPKIQLYNLTNDPGETTNLQASQPDKVEELRSLLTKYITEGRSTPGSSQQNDASEDDWNQIAFIE